MKIKISENILKLRKGAGLTQAQVAEFLGVTSQAVSKWEQEDTLPDIYLLPQLAFLFDVSLDYLFGTSDLKTADMQLAKYKIDKSDKSYKESKESIDTLIEMDQFNLEALALKCELEYERAIEFAESSLEVNQKMLENSKNDESWNRRAKIQQMRTRFLLGDTSFIDECWKEFNTCKSFDNIMSLLISLSIAGQSESVINLGTEYLDTFTKKEKLKIYPEILDSAVKIKDLELTEKYFNLITKYETDKHQVFNAWWLLWLLYSESNMYKEQERCLAELKKQLESLGINDYRKSIMLDFIDGKTKKPVFVL